ncbi:hypothetical protein MPSEU_000167800 [Mayamaea pseudoterrestris]|nr:hypothetical protein MPSEU_000167800 [Mayamaea pseudoterrestris]
MSPAAVWKEERFDDARTTLIDMASDEIEQVRVDGSSCFPSFPPACLAVLKTIAGNHQCVDCGGLNPTWAAVHYGALLCLQCSGHHRSLGVQVSCVRSVGMDEWSPEHLLQMLEGGNTQLAAFFARHNLTLDSCPERTQGITKENVIKLRYKTKAAEFYRTQLMRHAIKVLDAGPYRGRDISRSCHARTHRQLDRRNTTE